MGKGRMAFTHVRLRRKRGFDNGHQSLLAVRERCMTEKVRAEMVLQKA